MTRSPHHSNLVLKHFPATDLVSAFQETTLYTALKPYQDRMIPFCYGIFDIDDIDGIGILLENVPGLTLAEYLANLTIETDQIRSLYLNCFYALHCIHSAGYAHRDIRLKILSSSQSNRSFWWILRTRSKLEYCILIGTVVDGDLGRRKRVLSDSTKLLSV